MNVFENQFARFDVYTEHNLLVLTWSAETQDMSANEWKAINITLVEYFESFHISRLLANTEKLDFIVTPDLQTWAAQEVFPKSLENGLKAVAFVVSKDLFAAVSLEQTMNEGQGQDFFTQYFSDEQKAKEWLIDVLEK